MALLLLLLQVHIIMGPVPEEELQGAQCTAAAQRLLAAEAGVAQARDSKDLPGQHVAVQLTLDKL